MFYFVQVSRASFWCEFLVRVFRASVMGLRDSLPWSEAAEFSIVNSSVVESGSVAASRFSALIVTASTSRIMRTISNSK